MAVSLHKALILGEFVEVDIITMIAPVTVVESSQWKGLSHIEGHADVLQHSGGTVREQPAVHVR